MHTGGSTFKSNLSEDTMQPFTLLVWNINHKTRTEEGLSHLKQLIEKHDVDVACLQEVTQWSLVPFRRRSMRSALEQEPFRHLCYALHPRLYPGWREGVAVFSRFPVLSSREVPISGNRSLQ